MGIRIGLLCSLVVAALLGCGGGGDGAVDERSVPAQAGLSLQFHHTHNLAQAREVLAQGRQPIIDGTALLLEPRRKRLRADAAARLDRTIAEYPDVWRHQGLMIQVVDEVFLDATGEVSSPEEQREDLHSALAAINLLRSRLPRARLGVVVAPEAWLADPAVVTHFNALVHRIDWAATDVYFWTLHSEAARSKLTAAREFANHVTRVAPSVQRWIVIQGFAPMDLGPAPGDWSANDRQQFVGLLKQLFGVASAQYHGAVIWGWNLPEGSGLTPWRVFPDDLKQTYREGLAMQCLSGASDGQVAVTTSSACGIGQDDIVISGGPG